MSILGLDPTKPTGGGNCLFEKIVHANDADSDGIHIAEIYMGWWMKLAPDLFEQKRICRLMTPLAVLYSDSSKKKALKYFFTLDEYKTFEQEHPEQIKKGRVCYYKGLGSWSKDEFQKLFASSPNGIEDFLQPVVLKDKPIDEEILDEDIALEELSLDDEDTRP